MVFLSIWIPLGMDRQVASHSIHILPLSGMFGIIILFIISLSSNTYHLPSYAIKGSPNQKLLLEDIYYAIESRVCNNKTNLPF